MFKRVLFIAPPSSSFLGAARALYNVGFKFLSFFHNAMNELKSKRKFLSLEVKARISVLAEYSLEF